MIERDTADELSVTMIRLVKLLAAMRHSLPRAHPALDPSSHPALFSLADGPKRVSSLAECVHSDVSTTSRQVSTLVSLGLAAKVCDAHDKRVQLVRLTAEGETLIDQFQQFRTAWFQDLMGDWSEQDAASFASYLTRFVTELETLRADTISKHDPTHRPSTGWTSQPDIP